MVILLAITLDLRVVELSHTWVKLARLITLDIQQAQGKQVNY